MGCTGTVLNTGETIIRYKTTGSLIDNECSKDDKIYKKTPRYVQGKAPIKKKMFLIFLAT
jgi:hypothetical protein